MCISAPCGKSPKLKLFFFFFGLGDMGVLRIREVREIEHREIGRLQCVFRFNSSADNRSSSVLNQMTGFIFMNIFVVRRSPNSIRCSCICQGQCSDPFTSSEPRGFPSTCYKHWPAVVCGFLCSCKCTFISKM